jgi:hypothetical protein
MAVGRRTATDQDQQAKQAQEAFHFFRLARDGAVPLADEILWCMGHAGIPLFEVALAIRMS